MTYLEKLQDPRWQKKRKEALRRSNYKCEDCGSTKSGLEVHHCIYLKDREPWEYNGNSLIVVCTSCHQWRQEMEQLARQWLSVVLRYSDIETVCHWKILLESLGKKSKGYLKGGVD